MRGASSFNPKNGYALTILLMRKIASTVSVGWFSFLSFFVRLLELAAQLVHSIVNRYMCLHSVCFHAESWMTEDEKKWRKKIQKREEEKNVEKTPSPVILSIIMKQYRMMYTHVTHVSGSKRDFVCNKENNLFAFYPLIICMCNVQCTNTIWPGSLTL